MEMLDVANIMSL